MIAAPSLPRTVRSVSSFFALLLFVVNNGHHGGVNALDIEFDKLVCNQSLPAYIYPDTASMTCNNGQTRCTLGSTINIAGTVEYQYLYLHSTDSTGYVSANLKLLSVEYNLLKNIPMDFCASWITPGTYNENECPLDGLYHFSLPYTSPWDDQDIMTWFATGWQGTTDLKVYNDTTKDAYLLASCKFHWKTYVTESQEDGWHTMPSAIQATIILAAILAAMCLCCTYLTCCRRRRSTHKELIDAVEDKTQAGSDHGEDAVSKFRRMDDTNGDTRDTPTTSKLYKIRERMHDLDWA